jgi:hypothetical protein
MVEVAKVEYLGLVWGSAIRRFVRKRAVDRFMRSLGVLVPISVQDPHTMPRIHIREFMFVAAFVVTAAALVACGGGSSHESTTTTDTTVTPVKVRDTTVVDVTTDTVKKTHNKP